MVATPTDAFLTPLDGDTAVIACHFNPAGYHAPRANLARFLTGMADVGAPLFMAELAFYGQPFQTPGCARTAHFRAGKEAILFQKERLLNLVEKIVPPQFSKIVIWDADILIPDFGWLVEVSRALDAYPVVHPFTRAILLGPEGREIGAKMSVGYAANNRFPDPLDVAIFHPGFGLAVRRDFFTQVGGLDGCVITGSGDTLAMIGALCKELEERAFFRRHSRAWGAGQLEYCRRLYQFSGGRIGVLPADIHHLYHGSHANRAYLSRFDLTHQLDPDRDLRVNDDGITVWTAAAHAGDLPERMREYFFARREDD